MAIVLSIIFTVALFYSTFTLPLTLDKWLRNYYPDVFWHLELREHILSSLRPYGYLALILTIVLILVDFIARRRLPYMKSWRWGKGMVRNT